MQSTCRKTFITWQKNAIEGGKCNKMQKSLLIFSEICMPIAGFPATWMQFAFQFDGIFYLQFCNLTGTHDLRMLANFCLHHMIRKTTSNANFFSRHPLFRPLSPFFFSPWHLLTLRTMTAKIKWKFARSTQISKLRWCFSLWHWAILWIDIWHSVTAERADWPFVTTSWVDR